MNDTPITDRNKRRIEGFADEWVPRYVSEELERKLAVARTALKGLAEYESWGMPDLYSQPCCDEMVGNMNTIAKEALQYIES